MIKSSPFGKKRFKIVSAHGLRSDNISGIIIFIFAKAEKSADFPAFLFSQEGAVTRNNKKAIVFAFLHQRWLRIGAADEARTRYLHLGKVALYQMSYGRILETLLDFLSWCLRSESNQ